MHEVRTLCYAVLESRSLIRGVAQIMTQLFLNQVSLPGRVWVFLTEPSAALTDSNLRRRARLAAVTTLIASFFSVLANVIGIATSPLAPLIALTAYGFSRTRFFEFGMGAMVFVFTSIVFYNIITSPSDITRTQLVFIVLPLFIAAPMLNFRFLMFLALLGAAGAFNLQRNGPAGVQGLVAIEAGFVVVVSALILIITAVQQRYLIEPQLEELRRARREQERANAELEAANREVRNFAYIVAHDLRTPVVNFQGFVEEIEFALEEVDEPLRRAQGSLPETEQMLLSDTFAVDIPDSLHHLKSSTERMNQMLMAVLDLARQGRREFQRTKVDTELVIREITNTLRLDHVRLHIHHMPTVVADRVALQQIFGNLLDNAVKYLDPARPGRVEIWATVDEHETTFHVQDNGRGIAPDDHEKILQPFRRARNTADVAGAGMGLAYVQTLIRRLGGRIWFDSEPDIGTTFHFTLPSTELDEYSSIIDTQTVRIPQALLQPGA